MPVKCSACGAVAALGDAYCEGCGHTLAGGPAAAPAAPCARCGGRVAGGACADCGLARTGRRDHVEARAGTGAGVSDRGLRHSRNEDALALRALRCGGAATTAAVVCDGVSTSPRPAAASAVAAETGATALAEETAAGAAPAAALATALRRAGRAVTALGGTGPHAPACTFVAALVPARGPLTVAWVGDSRAYWLAAAPTAAPSALLTRDDTWAQTMVALNALTPEEAERSPHAHTLTAWLGADYGEAQGRTAALDTRGPGALLLCTDGLWNLLPDPADLAGLVLGAGPDPLDAARACVRLALERGGPDNVTACVIGVPAAPPPPPRTPGGGR
ncbi:protein phosphatase 2C domain-containing protein [Streptomonospora sp. S1-112]|uniref:Protein phosphatase 2C domain-containing protein n=1 Tax=Streptomonospora mangrovi TaxID=2883123 RepID=A0A9X3SHB9_9ACTN|nr:protein phosphatase 2C domain-containing protein [Streptomonospora mangrovi]MDA0565094.1 protein phosphatase 2C domain-containing protein [Streptomonospora mangrovi]